MIDRSTPVRARRDGETVDLGECEYFEYESAAEALEHLGETQLLDRLNAQVKTDAMNSYRQSKTKGPTKGALRTAAMSEIMQEYAEGQHKDVVGNEAALNALCERKMAEIKNRMVTS